MFIENLLCSGKNSECFLFLMKIFNLFIWLPWVLVTALELSSRSALAYLLCDMWELSSPIRDWTSIPCTARWILNHCTTRESHNKSFSCMFLFLCLVYNHLVGAATTIIPVLLKLRDTKMTCLRLYHWYCCCESSLWNPLNLYTRASRDYLILQFCHHM